MALEVWGDDCRPIMEHFEPSDGLLVHYKNNIVDCEHAIRGRRVLDMGCNNGIFSYLSLRHGAAHVVGVEPRGMFVDGLNAFSGRHGLHMEFHRGYDTDLPRLLREHDVDTVLLQGVDDITNWERMMYDIRVSQVEWLVMRMSTVPDNWMDTTPAVLDFAKSGQGMPVGFTLHFPGYNSTTRAGINPVNRDRADPDTGYQHLDHDGKLDLPGSSIFYNWRSRQYVRKFIEHTGMEVEHSQLAEPMPDSPSTNAAFGLDQWYLIRNVKN